jgi:nickel/cobalt exporter
VAVVSDFATLLQQGNSWLFVPSAVLLGALHGLEPGHSKTMMAAFIVAIRGTVAQAVLLGLAATLSHTAIVWAIALAGLHFGRQWNTATTEPWLEVVSAVLIVAVAAWMLWRTWRHRAAVTDSAHVHDHAHGHDHARGHERPIDTGHGVVRLEIFEQGEPPRFRLSCDSGVSWAPQQVRVVTERRGTGTRSVAMRRSI